MKEITKMSVDFGSYERIESGPLELPTEKNEFLITEVVGEIVKIRVRKGDINPEAGIKIVTEEGETLEYPEIDKDFTVYPRHDVATIGEYRLTPADRMMERIISAGDVVVIIDRVQPTKTLKNLIIILKK